VYHFELTLKPEVSARTRFEQSLAGDVTVNADDRITKITYARTARVSKDGHTEPSSVVDVTVELSGYGTAVNVEKPTDVVVVTK
jgi:hypothetical protein